VGKKRVALVLAGGAARGAYEVGIVAHVLEEVAKTLGREVRFDILCGTSVGALNACALAAHADLPPRERAERLVDVWTSLEIEKLVKTDVTGVLKLGARILGRAVPAAEMPAREGGLIDPSGLEDLVERSIPFERIDENLKNDYLEALTVSTTHIGSGKTVVFVQRKEPGLPHWSLDPTIEPRAHQISAKHALASAAIPILFRAVKIDGEFHCDGGLRQNVPLSPARRLGADGVLVINPRFLPTTPLGSDDPAVEDLFPGPLFLLGKTLNALLLDRIDTDLARLESINRILDAGTRCYGAGFVATLNACLGHEPGQGLRTMRTMLVRSSRDIGRLAAEYVRSKAFVGASGLTGRLIRRLADPESQNEADLLSYLLFDGQFARLLIELGRDDAKARHDELCAFFEAMSSG
jgi:NTE family protein